MSVLSIRKPSNPGRSVTEAPSLDGLLLPKPAVPEHQNLEHIFSLIGKPSSEERSALRSIVDQADIFEIDGCSFILAPITPEIVDILAAFESEHAELVEDDFNEDHLEDIEDDNEDCCSAFEDNLKAAISDGYPGDPEDSHPEGGPTGFNPWPWTMEGWKFAGYDSADGRGEEFVRNREI